MTFSELRHALVFKPESNFGLHDGRYDLVIRILEDQTDSQRVAVRPLSEDRSGGWLEETGNASEKRGFPGSVWPENRDALSRPKVEIYFVKNGLVRLVGKG